MFFAIICVAVTTGAVYYTLSTRDPVNSEKVNYYEEEPSKTNKITDTVKGIESYTDIYSENDLKILAIPITSHEYSSYIQISGLKNEAVEKSINEELKSSADYLMTLHKDSDETVISAYASCNFADILSVTVDGAYGYEIAQHQYEYKRETICLNYRLDTGEKIEFKDLFIDSANLKSIVSQSIYISLVEQYAFERFSEDDFNSMILDLKVEDYSAVEDEVFRYMCIYNKNGISTFDISPKLISFQLDGQDFYIKMPDFYKNIALFNRFKSNVSLYKEQNIGIKNLYVFMSPNHRGDVSILEKYSDNMFVDLFYIFSEHDVQLFSEEERADIIAKANDILDEFKSQSNLNLNKGFAYVGMVYASKDSSGNIVATLELTSHEMSRDFYDSDFELLLATEYAYEIFGGGLGPIYIVNKNLKNSTMNFDLSIGEFPNEEAPSTENNEENEEIEE